MISLAGVNRAQTNDCTATAHVHTVIVTEGSRLGLRCLRARSPSTVHARGDESLHHVVCSHMGRVVKVSE